MVLGWYSQHTKVRPAQQLNRPPKTKQEHGAIDNKQLISFNANWSKNKTRLKTQPGLARQIKTASN